MPCELLPMGRIAKVSTRKGNGASQTGRAGCGPGTRSHRAPADPGIHDPDPAVAEFRGVLSVFRIAKTLAARIRHPRRGPRQQDGDAERACRRAEDATAQSGEDPVADGGDRRFEAQAVHAGQAGGRAQPQRGGRAARRRGQPARRDASMRRRFPRSASPSRPPFSRCWCGWSKRTRTGFEARTPLSRRSRSIRPTNRRPALPPRPRAASAPRAG